MQLFEFEFQLLEMSDLFLVDLVLELAQHISLRPAPGLPVQARHLELLLDHTYLVRIVVLEILCRQEGLGQGE